MQNQTIFELYTDDNKSKYSILRTYLNLRKNYENSTSNNFPKLILLNFSSEFLTERKYLMNTLIFSGGISLDEIIKSTNSEASNVSSGNDGLKAEF